MPRALRVMFGVAIFVVLGTSAGLGKRTTQPVLSCSPNANGVLPRSL